MREIPVVTLKHFLDASFTSPEARDEEWEAWVPTSTHEICYQLASSRVMAFVEPFDPDESDQHEPRDAGSTAKRSDYEKIVAWRYCKECGAPAVPAARPPP